MTNSFNAKATLDVAGKDYEIFKLDAVSGSARLPFSLKILLENLLRNEDDVTVTRSDIEDLANWDPKAEPSKEIQYRPARVLMQDFTGRPGRGRSGRDARCDEGARRRPAQDQPAPAGGAGHRPFGAGRPFRLERRLRAQRGA